MTEYIEEVEVIKGLSIPQIRVLMVLNELRGGYTRTRISDYTGTTSVLVGKAVGKTDPVKRVEFENTQDGGFRKSLLSLGYVSEAEVDVEGSKELIISITPLGREAFAEVAHEAEILPPPRRRSPVEEVIEEME